MPILLVSGPKNELFYTIRLINDMETDELVAVLAHEIGHYKRNT
jgi:Zn-dependent protease with chaperone function